MELSLGAHGQKLVRAEVGRDSTGGFVDISICVGENVWDDARIPLLEFFRLVEHVLVEGTLSDNDERKAFLKWIRGIRHTNPGDTQRLYHEQSFVESSKGKP